MNNMDNDEVIKILKIAKISYELALDYDYCPSKGKMGYVEGIDGYSGCRPDEIAHAIMILIGRLK